MLQVNPKSMRDWEQILFKNGLTILLFLCAFSLFGQRVITGKVIDQETGEPLPFVNVFLKGTSAGATTEIDGTYRISTRFIGDTLVASFVGYIPQTKIIPKGNRVQIDFELTSETIDLNEVVFVAEENPAYAILRNVVKNKDLNNKESLKNYEYDSYTKIELDVAQLTEKFQKRKIVQNINKALDSIQNLLGEDGNQLIPIFISESISKLYVQNNPLIRREVIEKSNLEAVGVKNKKSVAQLTGVTFQEYNFYQNWMNIVEKEFSSPISNGWKTFYEYYLIDSLELDGHFCYKIDFEPKNDQDLAFKGTMYITKEEYALKQIDATVGKKANLNFIEYLHLYQEMLPTDAGPWLPSKTKFELKVTELGQKFLGVKARFEIFNKNWVLNKERPASFYTTPLELSNNVIEEDPNFWINVRPEPLSRQDSIAQSAINTVKELKSVKIIAEITKAVVSGYYSLGKIDLGPWIFTYANNDIEGSRIRLGFRTNDNWNEKLFFNGYVAYGTLDNRVKYSIGADYIISKKPWTVIRASNSLDIDQLGVLDESIRDDFAFSASTRFGELRRPHIAKESKVSIERDLRRGLTQQVTFQNRTFQALFPFQFNTADANFDSIFTTTEFVFETRFARDELFLFDNNLRVGLGPTRAPSFLFRYVLGVNNLFGGDFTYSRFIGRVSQRVNLGLAGVSFYAFEVGFTPNTLPFPLLKNHIGNAGPFFNIDAFNLQNPGEFVSDKYAFLKLSHSFEGFLFNRIPLFRRLKWRAVAFASVLYGDLSTANRELIDQSNELAVDNEGNQIQLDVFEANRNGVPYVEVGYGIDNILKIFRVSAFHRITYRDNPGAQNFGIRLLFSVRP